MNKKLNILLYSAVTFNLLMITVGAIAGSSLYWGFNLLSFFPPYAAIIIILFCVIILFPGYRDFLINLISKYINGINREYLPLVIIVIYTIFFIIFRIRVHFLGDGPMIIRMLPEMKGVSDMITTNEPGAYTLDLALQYILRLLMKSSYSPEMVYLLLSYTTGILFQLVLLKFVRNFLNDRFLKITVYIILFFTGSIIFFLGYVETYQIVYLMMLIYLVFATLYLNSKTKYIFVPSTAFGIWLSLHYLAAVFFPSFILLLIFNYRKNKIHSIISLFVFLLCFAAGFLATGLDFGEMAKRFIAPNESHWLPLLTDNNSIIPALSFSHIWNVINAELLVLPFGFLCLLAFLIIFFKQIKWSNISIIFLSTITFCSLVFIFLFNSYLGLSKDWDVVALMSMPILFSLVYMIITMFDLQAIKITLFSISYISFWQIMVWVILNWNTVISEQRNTHLDNEYLWEKDKLAIYNEEMGIYFRGKGDLETAKEKYIKGLKYAPNSERLILSLSNIYQKENNPDQAEKLIDSSIKNGNTGRKMMIELGVIEMKTGEYNKAIQVFKNITGTNQDDMEVLGNMASCYYSLKDYKTSIDYSSMVIKLNPSFPLPYIGIGDCYLSSGDTLKAKENYIRANELDKEHEYKEMIGNRLKNIR